MAPLLGLPSPRQRNRHLRHSRSASLARSRKASTLSRSSSESKAGKKAGTGAGVVVGMAHGPNATAESQITLALAASAAFASVGTGLGTFKGSVKSAMSEASIYPHTKRTASTKKKKSISPKSRKSRASNAPAGRSRGPSQTPGSSSVASRSSKHSSKSKTKIPRIAFVNVERKGEIYTPPPRGTFRSSYSRFLRSEVPDFDPGRLDSAYRLGFAAGIGMDSGTNAQAVWARHSLGIGPGDMLNPYLPMMGPALPPDYEAPHAKKKGKKKSKKVIQSASVPSSMASAPMGLAYDPITAYTDYLTRRGNSATTLHETSVLSISEFDLFSAARARAAAADERFAYHTTRFHKDSMRASGSGSSRSQSRIGSKESSKGMAAAAVKAAADAAVGAAAGGSGTVSSARSAHPASRHLSGSGSAGGSSGLEMVPEWGRSPAAPPPPRMRRWLREAVAQREGRSGDPARIEEVPEG